VVGDEAASAGRPSGHDPRGRKDREHPRPQRIGIRAADDHVRDSWYRAGTEALNGACGDENRHRRREPPMRSPTRRAETPRRTARPTEAIGELACDDDSDEIGEEETR